MYHSLFVTLYVTYCFITVYRYWGGVEKPLPRLYDGFLEETTESARVSKEREQRLALARDHALLQVRIERMEGKIKKYRTLAIVIVTLLLGIGIGLSIWSPDDPLQYVGAVGTVLGILFVPAFWVLDRVWSKGEK
jgi:hypothetical protein